MAKKKPCYINLIPAEIKRGQVGYARTTGFMGLLIRFGEWLKWRNGDVNHAFVITEEGKDYENIWVVQATLRGVVRSTLQSVIDGGYSVLIYDNPAGVVPEMVAEFAENEVGKPYGILSILCIALDITTPDWFIAFRRNWTWICSALTGEAMRYGGWYHSIPDIYTTTPAQLKAAHLECLE